MNFKLWLEQKATSGKEYFYNKKTKRDEPVAVAFIRFGEIPQGNSKNHLLNQYEKGVSVYSAYYDRITKKFILQSGGEQLLNTQQDISQRPAYLVLGKPVPNENGGDGEQLLDRNTIKIIRKLDPTEITTEQTPYLDILGNDIQTANVTFPEQNIQELRRKTFKIFNNMNLPKETNGFIDHDRNLFRIIIQPTEKPTEEKIYQELLQIKQKLKDTLGNASISMDYIGSPRIQGFENILFKIKNAKITLN